ncbi:MAG: TatD family hydrolase [Myxococcota bacterium]|jgi:TatD DNase family protein|nr:TatD family hydrolase [Myxococcota bacterium]
MTGLRCFDTHCHVLPEYYGDTLSAVLERARRAGLIGLLNVASATEPETVAAAFALAEAHEELWVAAGVHPHQAAQATAAHFEALRGLCAHPRLLALGESGLDYHYMSSPRERQLEVFTSMLELALQMDKPLIIHSREADDDCARLLRASGLQRGVLHSFSSSWPLAETALEAGLFISFSGMLTFRSAESIRACAKRTPLERLLVETDAPYLAPVPLRGKRNEPAYVGHTAAFLAELRGMRIEALLEQLEENTRRCFDWPG